MSTTDSGPSKRHGGVRTPSGIEVPVAVTRDMLERPDVEPPGEYPFTRGIFADGYRGRLWT
ncbi:MAG: methylmalonyl-CoA mutase, partial [Candidatus Rokubacteria bacterium]|nr:methylmalonyl-CoA mutase [Candidatus Rokubacteria bacterium]